MPPSGSDIHVLGATRAKRVAAVLTVAVAYGAVAALGSMTTTLPGGISPIFPSAGIALAAVLILGRGGLPGVLIGSVAANIAIYGVATIDRRHTLVPLFIGVGASLAAWAGACLVRRFCGDEPPLSSARNILVFVTLGAFGSAAVSATIGVITLLLTGVVQVRGFAYSWLTWLLGDGFGSVIIAPLILAWHHRSSSTKRPWHWVEATALGSLTLLLGMLVFFKNEPFEYGLMPLLIWAAFRFGIRGTSAAATAIALLATIGTAMGKSPFVRETPNDSLLALHSFLGVTVVFAMIMAGVLLERRNAFGALRDSQEQLSAVFNCSANAIALTDPDTGMHVDVNDTWVGGTGLSRKDVIGRTGAQLDLWQGTQDRRQPLTALERDGRLRDFEVSLRTPAGVTDCAINAEFLEVRGRRLVLWEIRDLTLTRLAQKEKERLNAELHQAQKMEAIGRLAGGVAHDFNNLLTVIMGGCDLVLENPKLQINARQDVETVREASESAANLTRQLLAFSRKQVLQLAPLDLNVLVTRTERMLRRIIGEDIDLVTHLGVDLWPVFADAGQIEQVIMNLAVNSRDAMPKGGNLIIETSNVMLDDEFARQHTEARPGDYAMLSVTDSGVGMDAATLNLIFEPFFSTKGQLGSGLGLSTVHGIVQQSGGYILPSSELGRGTTFKIYLPRNEMARRVAEVPLQPIPATSRGETVLVVEDAETVRKLVVNLLARRGHEVLQAGSAEEALRVAASQAGTIELLITDLVLPGMSGPEMATQLAAARPGLAVLYMSGHTDHAIFRHSVLDPGIDFIPKPFRLDDLARKVEDMLNRRGTSGA